MVTFETKNGKIMMLKKNALEILDLLNIDNKLPGALDSDKFEIIKKKLKVIYKVNKENCENIQSNKIYLYQRLYPLIKLLERSEPKKNYLIWH